MPLTRVTDAIPSTTLTIASGTVGAINDNNTATVCVVQGTASTDNWFILDLGRERNIGSAELKNWYEETGTDTSFTIRYSNSPLGVGTVGTTYGTSFSAVAYPGSQTTGQIGTANAAGTISARYWSFVRAGNFTGVNIGVADFNVYEVDASGLDTTSKMW